MWFFCKILENASFYFLINHFKRKCNKIGRNSQTDCHTKRKTPKRNICFTQLVLHKDLTLILIIRRKWADFRAWKKTASGKRQILLFPRCLIFRNPNLILWYLMLQTGRVPKILWEDKRQANKSYRARRGFGKEMDLSNFYQVCKHVQNIPDCPRVMGFSLNSVMSFRYLTVSNTAAIKLRWPPSYFNIYLFVT